MEKNEIIHIILKSEGGLNESEPENVGGVSNYGITEKALNDFRKWLLSEKGIANIPKSVRDIKEGSEIIYEFYDWYFEQFHVWELPECLWLLHADFATNSGSGAVKVVQQILGLQDDGVWGSGTTKAVATFVQEFNNSLTEDPELDNHLIMEYHELKLSHYQNLVEKNPDKYGKWHNGWKKRAQHVLAELQPYFQDNLPSTRAVEEDQADLNTEIETSESIISETPKDAIEAIGKILIGHLDKAFDKLNEKLENINTKIENNIAVTQAIESKIDAFPSNANIADIHTLLAEIQELLSQKKTNTQTPEITKTEIQTENKPKTIIEKLRKKGK